MNGRITRTAAVAAVAATAGLILAAALTANPDTAPNPTPTGYRPPLTVPYAPPYTTPRTTAPRRTAIPRPRQTKTR